MYLKNPIEAPITDAQTIATTVCPLKNAIIPQARNAGIPTDVAKKYQEIRLGTGYSVDLNGIYYVKECYEEIPTNCNEMEKQNDDYKESKN